MLIAVIDADYPLKLHRSALHCVIQHQVSGPVSELHWARVGVSSGQSEPHFLTVNVGPPVFMHKCP